MKNYLIHFLLLSGLVASGCGPLMALAHTAEAAEADLITISDLGIENPGLLPTNPFYFLKEWGRGARRVFTFNPVAKVELELRITNEKAAETKKVEETRPADAEAVTEALENYQEAQGRLKLRLEALKETSQNPNVDRLLNELADRTVKHQKLFDELVQKFESVVEVKTAVEKSKEKNEEAIAAGAAKDEPAKFAAKLESALIASKGGDLKHVQSVELIDRLQEKTSEKNRESLERLKRNFSERLEEDIKKALEKDGSEKVRAAIEELPGDASRRSILFEEIKASAEMRVKEVLEKAAEKLEKSAAKEKQTAEKAKEQIERAQGLINKVEARTKEIDSPTRSALRLLGNAREHLEEAREAYDEEKYGEAFGQARSAEVLARNANQISEEEKPQTVDDLKQQLIELAAKIDRYEQLLKEREYTPEKQPKAYALLEEARKHLGFAEAELSKGNREGVKLHIGHVKGFLHDLSRIIEGEVRVETELKVLELRSAMPTGRQAKLAPATKEQSGRWRNADSSTSIDTIASPASRSRCEEIKKSLDQLWETFKSGRINEKDYNLKYEALKKELSVCESNSSVAAPAAAGGTIKDILPSKQAEPVYCTQQYDPVCAENGKTYSNECTAKVAGVAMKYRGECGRPEEKPLPQPAPATSVEPKFSEPAPATESVKEIITSVAPSVTAVSEPALREFKLEADDYGFYPSGTLTVPKGSKVKIHFIVRTTNVYYGGLDFRSSKFKTESVKPGGVTSVEFTADESFEFSSYWPASGVLKSTGKIVVQ